MAPVVASRDRKWSLRDGSSAAKEAEEIKKKSRTLTVRDEIRKSIASANSSGSSALRRPYATDHPVCSSVWLLVRGW